MCPSVSSAGLPIQQGSRHAPRRARLAYFLSHPIQYQIPLLRKITSEPDIDLTVYYFSDLSLRAYDDPGFGVKVHWDIPLLGGYRHEFLPRLRDRGGLGFADPINRGILDRLRHENFDAVWVHGYHTLNHLHAIFAARLLGIPVLLRTDSSLTDRLRSQSKLLAKDLFFSVLRGAVSGILSVGDANTAYWRHHLGAAIPIFPMPYAVDNDFFRAKALAAAPRREQLRAELGLEPGRPVILFASKLQTRKRCIDLVNAFLALPDRRPAPYLLIAGDGEERENIERRVRESGNPSIRLLGFQNQTQLPALFDLCDLFVLPSVLEPYGLIVNEVMNAARPIVVSDQVGCQPDLVQDGHNGLVFPAGNVPALTQALHRLLHDEPLRKIMGGHSLERIQHFTFDQDIAGLRRALAHFVTGFAS